MGLNILESWPNFFVIFILVINVLLSMEVASSRNNKITALGEMKAVIVFFIWMSCIFELWLLKKYFGVSFFA